VALFSRRQPGNPRPSSCSRRAVEVDHLGQPLQDARRAPPAHLAPAPCQPALRRWGSTRPVGTSSAYGTAHDRPRGCEGRSAIPPPQQAAARPSPRQLLDQVPNQGFRRQRPATNRWPWWHSARRVIWAQLRGPRSPLNSHPLRPLPRANSCRKQRREAQLKACTRCGGIGRSASRAGPGLDGGPQTPCPRPVHPEAIDSNRLAPEHHSVRPAPAGWRGARRRGRADPRGEGAASKTMACHRRTACHLKEASPEEGLSPKGACRRKTCPATKAGFAPKRTIRPKALAYPRCGLQNDGRPATVLTWRSPNVGLPPNERLVSKRKGLP